VEDAIRGPTEIYQPPVTATVTADEIKGINFVFQEQDILIDKRDVYRVQDVFLLRKRQKFDDKSVDIPNNQYLASISSYGPEQHSIVYDAQFDIY
jgi:hypothetical protein